MKKFDFNYPETDRMIIFTEKAPLELRGKKLPITLAGGGFPDLYMRFDDKLDLANQMIIRKSDPEFETSDAPTLNDLMAEGIIAEWKPFAEINLGDVLNDPRFSNNGRPDLKAIQTYCKEQGMKVSLKALQYVRKAWNMGFKVGHVDKTNKVHVFCPSGQLNPLSYHITALHPTAKDWQIDYLC